MFEFQTHRSMREIAREDWNALLGQDPEPFLRWEFLEAFEATGCVDPTVGWAPVPITIRENGVLVGAAPAYVKGNSEGEFVFDHGWARFAYEELRYEYYPKLIVACPFTPATGRRVIVKEGASIDAVTEALATGVRLLSEQLGLSSAHVLFPRQEELERWSRHGFAVRNGIQYHWANAGYSCFDDFLARYNAKRRHQVRRERKELAQQGLVLKSYSGSDITPEVLDTMYTFYCGTVEKYHWGRQYLNRDFFQELGARMRDSLFIVFAHEQSGEAVAGAFNLVGRKRMFGRYWGCSKDYKYLHFNVCYYAGIEECIERKLEVFEPGAGGEHKVVRGFEPTQTYSAHVFNQRALDRAVRSFLRRETHVVEESLSEGSDLFVR